MEPMPVIELSTNFLISSCTEGEDAPSDSFTVRNSGSGTLDYSISNDANWLYCTPNTGTSTGEADSITVKFTTSGLNVGTYYSVITVSDPHARNSPQEVDVTLAVSGGKPGELWGTDSIVGYLYYVPAGTFIQGSPSDEPCRYSCEDQFTHTLTRNLAVMETEVTQGMWEALDAVQPDLPDNHSYFSGSDRPVERVSWYEAVLFANLLSMERGLTRCYYRDASFTTPVTSDNYISWSFYCNFNANGYRLPTEGEWEYFCRAGTMGPFWVNEPNYTSDTCGSPYCVEGEFPNLDQAAVFCAIDPGGTALVGGKDENPWGLRDVHGNVMEWCWDWYYGEHYPFGSLTDYEGPDGGDFRVLRGGGWNFPASWCRSSERHASAPGCHDNYRGFRLVRTLPED